MINTCVNITYLFVVNVFTRDANSKLWNNPDVPWWPLFKCMRLEKRDACGYIDVERAFESHRHVRYYHPC